MKIVLSYASFYHHYVLKVTQAFKNKSCLHLVDLNAKLKTDSSRPTFWCRDIWGMKGTQLERFQN